VSLNEDSTSYGPVFDAKCLDITWLVHFSAACSGVPFAFSQDQQSKATAKTKSKAAGGGARSTPAENKMMGQVIR